MSKPISFAFGLAFGIALALAVMLGAGCAGSVDGGPPPETDAPIIGGQTDTGDPSVVIVFAQENGSQQGSLCTASVIAPTVLLTAAHCVAPSEVGSNVTFSAFLGSDFNGAGQWLAVKETHFDQAFNPNNLNGGHDVGIVILAQPVSLTPLPYNRTSPSALAGKAVRLVGYGVNNGQAQTGAGIKRQVTTTLDSVSSLLLKIGNSSQGTCQGDSGGPAFMNVGGVETIVGITSFGAVGCGDGGHDTRIDLYASFIDQYVNAAGSPPPPASNPPPSNNPPPPSPPPTPPPPSNACDANQGWETEPNNQPSQANGLCSTGQIYGAIDASGDVDWFTWTVAANRDYYVTLGSLPADYNMTLYKVVSGSLSIIATATDAHDGADQTIARHTSDGGTYYLKVFGVNGASDSQYGYAVTVTK